VDTLVKKKSDLITFFFVDRLRRLWHNASRSSRYVSSASGRVVEVVRALRTGGSDSESTGRAEDNPRLEPSAPGEDLRSKKARALFAAKPETRRRREEVLSGDPGSDPFRHSIPTVESTSVFGKACSFAGAQSERRPRSAMRKCTSTRMGFHPISHASTATRGARRSQGGGTSGRKPRRVTRDREIARRLPLLSSFGLRASHVLRAHLKGVARGGGGSRASGARLSRPSVGEARVARCGATSSDLLCIEKRKVRAA
jgi:hypothetical protein